MWTKVLTFDQNIANVGLTCISRISGPFSLSKQIEMIGNRKYQKIEIGERQRSMWARHADLSRKLHFFFFLQCVPPAAEVWISGGNPILRQMEFTFLRTEWKFFYQDSQWFIHIYCLLSSLFHYSQFVIENVHIWGTRRIVAPSIVNHYCIWKLIPW